MFGSVFTFGVIALMVCVPGELCAQPSSGPQDITIPLDQLLQAEVQTVVGASRYRQRVIDAPASITIVTAEEITRFGYRTLADVLRGVKGFYVTYDRNYSYLGVRGFARPGDYNTRVLVLIDGHRLNDNVYDAVQIGTDFPLDLALVERIEVVRGPSSSAYGSNAFFGVINIITKSASALERVTVAGEVGSLGTGELRGTVAHGADTRGVVASFSRYRSDGEDATAFPSLGVVATDMDQDAAWRAFVSTTAGAWRLQGVASSRKKQIPTGSYGTSFEVPGSHTVDARLGVSAAYERSLRGTDVHWRGAFDWVGYDGTYVEGPDVSTSDLARGRWFSSSASFSRRVGARHYLNGGLDLRRDTLRRQAGTLLDAGSFDIDRPSHAVGVWLGDEYRLSPRLLLNATLGYDKVEHFDGAFTLKAAVIAKPSEHTLVKLLHGTAFRSPNAYELHYYERGEIAPLVPERVRTSEVLVERQLTRAWRASVGVFHSASDQLITMTTVSGNSWDLGFRNTEETHTRGVEFESEISPGRSIHALASYTYQRAGLEPDDIELSNAPRHLLQLRMSGGIGPITIGAEAITVGTRLTVDGRRLPAASWTNVTLTPTKPASHIRPSLTVKNVFNSRIEDPAGEEHRQPSIRQDGRTVRLGIVWAF